MGSVETELHSKISYPPLEGAKGEVPLCGLALLLNANWYETEES